MQKIRIVTLVGVLVSGACGGPYLQLVDTRAEINQERAALAILQRTDGGAISSLAEAIYCSARGTLLRGGIPCMDAGVPCPAQ
jgi:hypothetical protein